MGMLLQKSFKVRVKMLLQQIFTEQAKFDKEATWWSDVRPEKQAERLVFYQGMMKRAEGIDEQALSGQEAISLDIFKFILEDKIKRIEFSDYLMPFCEQQRH